MKKRPLDSTGEGDTGVIKAQVGSVGQWRYWRRLGNQWCGPPFGAVD